jgi:hypothetical protein
VLASFWSRIDSVPVQDIGDRRSANSVTKVVERTLDSRVAPPWVLPSHSHDQVGDDFHDARTAGGAPLMGPFLCNEPSVPTKYRVWGNERSDFGERPSSDGFAPNREPAPLIVSQSESPAPELLLENAILFAEIVDNGVLLAPDPARECDHKNLKL